MPVRLRLARVPLTRNSPRYTLVATNSISRNSALPLETLGTYNPIPTLPPPVARSPNGQIRSVKEWGARQALKVGPQQTPGEKSVQWNEGRVKWWLQQGAVPTKSVEKLLVRAGLLNTAAVLKPSERPISRLRRIREAVRAASPAATPQA